MAKRKATHKPTRKAWGRRGWQERFLVALAEHGVVRYACLTAGVDRKTAYNARKRDPEFAAKWEDAIEDATDCFEMEAIRRATKGTLRPVFYQGKKIGDVREYSDGLLVMLLKANRAKYRRDGADATEGNEQATTLRDHLRDETETEPTPEG